MINSKNLLLLFSCCLCTSKIHAGSYHNEATVYGAAESHDDQFDGDVVWIEFVGSGGSTLHATGVMLNEWYGLTAAHVILGNGQFSTDFVVGTGDNYLTNPGSLHGMDGYGTHPTWSGTFSGGYLSEIDLAWFKLDAPIPSAGVDLGAAELGDVLTVPEFGVPATPSGYLTVDGERRAFDAVFDETGNGQAWSSDYIVSSFYPTFVRNLPLAGSGTDGSSGSPWFNENGELSALTSSGVGTPFHGSRTAAVDLAPHHDWIIANTTVPEPATLSFVLLGAMTIIRRRY